MTDLIQRLTDATGPDRELDAEIALAVLGMERDGPIFHSADETFVLERDYYSLEGGPRELPAYTASIDAAITLVPEGWTGIIPITGGDEAWLWPISGPPKGHRCNAATPALALLIAALKVGSKETGHD